MAKTSTQRNRQFVERLKSTGQYEAYKKKIASKRKIRNDSRINSIKSLPERVQQKFFREQREYVRKKVAKCRERKKKLLSATSTQYAFNTLTTSSTSSTRGYNSASALNKAVEKLKRAAPKSLEKKKEAVRKLLFSFDVNDREEIILGTAENRFRKTNALSTSVIKSVQGFYQRDDVSRMSPHVKDCKNYVNSVTGAKQVKQTRYLMYKVSEVYNMFLKEFQEQENDSIMAPLKATEFYELRPDHVKLVSDTPLETCLCIYQNDLQIDFAEGIKCEEYEEI